MGFGVVHLFGIESPGLTGAIACGEVTKRLRYKRYRST
jgi:hypothetical protein